MSQFVLLFMLKREHQSLQHSTITGYYAVSSKLGLYKYVKRQIKTKVKKQGSKNVQISWMINSIYNVFLLKPFLSSDIRKLGQIF